MFVDEVILELQAGDGGNGCMAFRREKYVEMGGPFGGNGGRGSNIKFVVDEGLNTLIDLKYKKVIKGNKGVNGEGKGKHGANADDVIVRVPAGTVITDLESGLVIADLTDKTDEVIAAYGGRGGRGNIAFATRSNPAPAFAENGEPGEIRKEGYAVSVIDVKGQDKDKEKYMLFIEIDKKRFDHLRNLIKELDEKAFIVVNETRMVQNGYFK